jgi:quercetin dioxygenase-like cupin family protein
MGRDKIRLPRLYNDESGDTHFDEIEIRFVATDYVSAAPSIELSDPIPAAQARLMRVNAGWRSDWHPSANRAMFFVLSGAWEVTASDGESRRFGLGAALLVEDTSVKVIRRGSLVKRNLSPP